MSLQLLKKLCETPGTPGREERVRELVKQEMAPLVDEMFVDTIGNVIGIKKGKGNKKIMVAGHMDEIGFMVSYIDDKGFIRIQPMGGFDPRNLIAQRVVVHGRKDLNGVLMPGIKPTHISSGEKKTPTLGEFFIDLGLNKEEVEKFVRIGDFVTLDRGFMEMGNLLCSKALDDRAGVYIMLEALRNVKNNEADIYAVATVQEEVGLRGAVASAFLNKPDIGVALDVTLAVDIPGTPDHSRITALGEGAAIKLRDSASISNYKLVDFMRDLAEKEDIKYQMEILPRGGTDAGAIEKAQSGCPVITISLPTRYVHTVNETADKKDLENCIKLLTKFLETAHNGDFTL
ncbi:M42 family metallopeptidase [Clostridium sp. 'deep sea']|uniref:M42 family metallopeptidase n=1 Tax=Clostridium sp. 'deep sea' TaxID=2779445 RepID=UPI00189659AE|nr:M42 family metallopeptidase [Clostridium sp. 'deep sea']QOR33695.1 M42 family metallopeptidase [Clostridium sp. 'deep sea']